MKMLSIAVFVTCVGLLITGKYHSMSEFIKFGIIEFTNF